MTGTMVTGMADGRGSGNMLTSLLGDAFAIATGRRRLSHLWEKRTDNLSLG